MNGSKISGPARSTATLAQRAYNQLVKAALNPKNPEEEKPPPPKVVDYVELLLAGPWKDAIKQKRMSPMTWSVYKSYTLSHLVDDPFGQLPLDQVTTIDCEGWMGRLTKKPKQIVHKEIYYDEHDRRRVIYSKVTSAVEPLANSTKRRIAGMVISAFTRAVKVDKFIDISPWQDLQKPQAEPTDFLILSMVERRLLFKICKSLTMYQNVAQRTEMVMRLGLHGLSPGEICGVRHEFFDGEVLDLRTQVNRIDGKVQERDTFKTPTRKDFVAIHDPVLADFLKSKASGFVLASATGTPLEPGNLYRMIRKLVSEWNMRNLSPKEQVLVRTRLANLDPYDFRHTFAMDLLDQGVDYRTGAEMMRNTPEVFIRLYCRSDRGRKLAAARKLSVLAANYSTNYTTEAASIAS